MTVFMLPAAFAFMSALMTKKNTRMGATARKAETNSVPRSEMTSPIPAAHSGAFWGIKSAKMTPMIRPMMIFLMRLTLL